MKLRHRILVKTLPVVFCAYFFTVYSEYKALKSLKNRNYIEALHQYEKLATVEEYVPYLPRLFHYSSFNPSYSQIVGEIYYKKFINGFGSSNRSTFEHIIHFQDILKSLPVEKIKKYKQSSRHFEVFKSIVESYDKGKDSAYHTIHVNFNSNDKVYMEEHNESLDATNLIIDLKNRKYIIRNMLDEKYKQSIQLLREYRKSCLNKKIHTYNLRIVLN